MVVSVLTDTVRWMRFNSSSSLLGDSTRTVSMKLGEPAGHDAVDVFELVWNLGFLGVIDGRDRDVGVHRKAAALVVDNRLVAADHAATLKLLYARLHGGHGQACRLGKVGQRGSAILFKHVEDYAIGRVELARNRTCVYRTIVTVGHSYPFSNNPLHRTQSR